MNDWHRVIHMQDLNAKSKMHKLTLFKTEMYSYMWMWNTNKAVNQTIEANKMPEMVADDDTPRKN